MQGAVSGIQWRQKEQRRFDQWELYSGQRPQYPVGDAHQRENAQKFSGRLPCISVHGRLAQMEKLHSMAALLPASKIVKDLL